jgi:hypothetical protein
MMHIGPVHWLGLPSFMVVCEHVLSKIGSNLPSEIVSNPSKTKDTVPVGNGQMYS